MGVGVEGMAVWGEGVDRKDAPGYVSLPANREAGQWLADRVDGLTSRGCSSVVERHVANVKVEGSSPFTRFEMILDEAPRSGAGLFRRWRDCVGHRSGEGGAIYDKGTALESSATRITSARR